MRKSKKSLTVRKRFWADCCRCTASFDADRLQDTQKRCSCGEVLTWNDNEKLKTLKGER